MRVVPLVSEHIVSGAGQVEQYERKLDALLQQEHLPYSKRDVPTNGHMLGTQMNVLMQEGEGGKECKLTRVYEFAYCAIQDKTYLLRISCKNAHVRDLTNDEILTARMKTLDEKVRAQFPEVELLDAPEFSPAMEHILRESITRKTE